MSYLRFRPLKYVEADNVECLLLAWPVLAVPVRCWAVSPAGLDAMEETVLGLAGAGIAQMPQLQGLLGIPDSMAAMVERTVRQLRTRGLLAESGRLTEEGEKLLHTAELPKTYQAGLLLFDQVRGKMFPFVLLGRPKFFRSSEIAAFAPLRLNPKVDLPPDALLRRECSLAVAAHNRRSALLELLDDDDASGRAAEQERELDLPLEPISHPEHLGDVEVLARDLVEPHHLLIEVVGRLPPGNNDVLLQSYSPFSPWEQQQYVQVVTDMKEPAVSEQLAAFTTQVKQQSQGHLAALGLDQADWHARLNSEIVEKLGPRPMLPIRALDQLRTCEQDYQLAERGESHGVLQRREFVGSQWGILLETTLEAIAKSIDEWSVPTDWYQRSVRGFNAAKKWYRNLAQLHQRPPSWLDVPGSIVAAVSSFLRQRQPTAFGQLRCDSSRDHAAKILLAVLSVGSRPLPESVSRFVAALESKPGWLQGIDFVADWRNDCAHGGKRINSLTSDEYLGTLRDLRSNVYGFLRDVYAE